MTLRKVAAWMGRFVARLLAATGGDPELASKPLLAARCERDGTASRESPHPSAREEDLGEGSAEGAGEVRAPFGPVDAGAGEAASLPLDRGELDPELTEPSPTGGRDTERVVVAPEEATLEKSLAHGNSELAGEVVVTGARALDRARCLGLTERPRRAARRNARKHLECIRNLRARKPEEAVAACVLSHDKADIAERAQVPAGTRR